jgi:hypothetical protein
MFRAVVSTIAPVPLFISLRGVSCSRLLGNSSRHAEPDRSRPFTPGDVDGSAGGDGAEHEDAPIACRALEVVARSFVSVMDCSVRTRTLWLSLAQQAGVFDLVEEDHRLCN